MIGSWLIGGMIGGGVVNMIWNMIYSYSLNRRLTSMENTLKSEKGVEARREKGARRIEAFQTLQKLQKEGDKDAIQKTLMAYPDIALDMLSKLGD